jgi:hypothetical protein
LAASKSPNALGSGSDALASRGGPDEERTPREAWPWRVVPVVAALLLIAVVAWRARYGISFFDDGHYASLSLRLSQGARPFSDEMTAQSLGFLIPAMFARAWRALFGMYGLVLALRLLYVVAAAGIGILVYRALRPSYPAAALLLAVSAPLLALPYNIVGLSYNTTAMLAFLASWAFLFQAVRDADRGSALGAGVAAAIGAISYPPLVFGALALLATCIVVRPARSAALPAFVGGALTAAVFSAWLLAVASVPEIRAALAYSSSVLDEAVSLGERALTVARQFAGSLATPWLLPMWASAAGACLRRPGRSWTSIAALSIPIAALIPSVAALRSSSPGDTPAFGALGGAYLIVLAAGLFVPVLVWTLQEGGDEMRLALSLATPVSVANTLAAAYFTSSGWEWCVPVIGVAPLVTVLLAGWFRMSTEPPESDFVGYSRSAADPEVIHRDATGYRWRAIAASLVATLILVALVGMLYATAFKDAPPRALTRRLTAPAVVGIVTQDVTAERVSELVEAGRRWVEPGEGVLFVHGQLGYVLVDAPMVTNAVWLATGPSDAETLRYFERTSTWPDVVFISSSLLDSLQGDPRGVADDPLLAYVDSEYEIVDEAGGFVVFRRP